MKNKAILILRICAVVFAVFSLSYRLIFCPIHGQSFIYQLGFFSMQSSLFIAIIFILLLINQLRGKPDKNINPSFRGAALMYGIVTMLMFFSFFKDTFDLQGFNLVILYINHVVLALLLMIDNIIMIKPQTYKWDLLIYWMIYPFYYLVFTIVESLSWGHDRYYFLVYDKVNAIFYPFALLLMSFIFLIIGVVLIFWNKIYKRPLKTKD
ncbi:MAG: Pr6Pr family membrane protein [Candidatus Marinimicrobia bacterium]|nr:Pr6Pr family membrane protein [Candidatus Neomarinimicrobiota bacterium]